MGRLPSSLARVAVGLVLLAGVVGLTTSPQALLRTVAGLDLRFAGAAVALLPVGLVLQWWKWRVLLRAAAPEVSGADALRSLLAGFGLGLITPGRVGELGRGLILPGRRLAATQLAGADRTTSAGVTLLAGALSASVLPGIGGGWLLGGAASVVAIGGAGWYLLRRCRHRREWLEVLSAVPGRGWAANLCGSAVFNLVFFAQFHLLLLAAGPLPPSVFWSVPAVFALKTLLPISFLDLGVREFAAVSVLGLAGVQPAVALQAALALCAVNLVVPGLAGLIVLGQGRWSPVSVLGPAHAR